MVRNFDKEISNVVEWQKFIGQWQNKVYHYDHKNMSRRTLEITIRLKLKTEERRGLWN